MNDTDIIRDLNTMPVNVKARGLLEMLGEEAREGSLHCVHAALYAIEKGEVVVETDVAETVNAMMNWRPPRLVNFLMLMSGEDYDPPGWETAADLREFAGAILDDIEAKMVTHFPYYRSPES
ncbi:MAG TPA: hypothetical protein PKN85_06745 [Syntrophorhabdaceae bacterium]|nr:hypothetical protein [Syntrophorhabdaceae bacterium]